MHFFLKTITFCPHPLKCKHNWVDILRVSVNKRNINRKKQPVLFVWVPDCCWDRLENCKPVLYKYWNVLMRVLRAQSSTVTYFFELQKRTKIRKGICSDNFKTLSKTWNLQLEQKRYESAEMEVFPLMEIKTDISNMIFDIVERISSSLLWFKTIFNLTGNFSSQSKHRLQALWVSAIWRKRFAVQRCNAVFRPHEPHEPTLHPRRGVL